MKYKRTILKEDKWDTKSLDLAAQILRNHLKLCAEHVNDKKSQGKLNVTYH